jgi:hypothetical protein
LDTSLRTRRLQARAVFAGLLLSGAEAFSLAAPANVQPVDVRLVELEGLPDATNARTVLSSKLFLSHDHERAAPIHRVIAEYLDAFWLAR